MTLEHQRGTLRAAILSIVALCSMQSAWSQALDVKPMGSTDWPHWRGPLRDGVSSESGWDPVGRAGVLWERSVGIGHSSFAIVGDVVFALGHDIDAGLDRMTALDVDTGEQRWTQSWAAGRLDNSHHGGTLTTPSVTDSVVHVAGREGRVAAYDAGSGESLWVVTLAEQLGLQRPTWGFAASPVVCGDLVLVSLGVVVALDRTTGEVHWTGEPHRGSAYSTPAPFVFEGEQRLAVLCGEGMSVVALEDGHELAFHRWDKAPRVAPMTPVVVDDRIFISGGYERGAQMLRFTGDALVEEWSVRTMRNKMSGCVQWNRHLYGFDESILKCMDLDGQVLWRKRGLGTGSLSIAGGRLVILDGRGQVVIALATPIAYTELSRRAVFDDGTFWSTPVLSHGRIFCRSSRGRMACLDHREGPDRTTAEGRAANQRVAAALLDAEEILERHARSVRRADAVLPGSARFVGTVRSLRNTEREGPVEVVWVRGVGFAWREAGLLDAPPFELGHDGARGWTSGRHLETHALEGEELDALREAGDIGRLLDPAAFYGRRAVLGVTLFDHRSCYVVAAATQQGHARKLYFEVDTGRLAGHEGATTMLWMYDDYRDVGGVDLPHRWSFFDPDTGEMTSAQFESVVLGEDVDAGEFMPPASAARFLRTAAEIDAAETELRERFGDLLGEWVPDAETDDAARRLFWIEHGFLASDRPQESGNYWTGPDDRGRMSLIGATYLTFGIERDEQGRAVAVQVFVDDEPRTRLIRALRHDGDR